MDDLERLAELIRKLNAVGTEIAALIGRPAQIGHVGEHIASRVLGIALEASATSKGIDGRFVGGPLAGRSVNIKWYPKREGILDITPNSLPDFYLVLTGPKSAAMTSRGAHRPWVIESVFLFNASDLIGALAVRGVKLGIATSVRSELWDKAEIYPVQRNNALPLSDEQRRMLALFR